MSDGGKDLGNVPAGLCSAMAPLYDVNQIVFDYAYVSFVEAELALRSDRIANCNMKPPLATAGATADAAFLIKYVGISYNFVLEKPVQMCKIKEYA